MPPTYKQNKRVLEDRSHLCFYFPQSNGRSLRAFLPFMENCVVSENKRASYSEYSLLSRNNSLYSYTGAKSRQINVKFNLTLMHILENEKDLNDRFRRQFQVFYDTKEAAKQSFFMKAITGLDVDPTPFDTKMGKGFDHAGIHRKYYQEIAKIKAGGLNFFDQGVNEVLSFLGSPTPTEDQKYAQINKAMNLIVYWINLIRSSVNNNAKKTTLGPPIVRFTHGPMYNNIACIVDNYSLSIDDQAGFDVQTMMPKRIEITLLLNEIKAGDFGEFKVAELVSKDNNNGWEAVFENNNMDPYGGVVDGRL